MRFRVVAVGKLKERFWVDACAEYLKRLGAYAKIEVKEIADIDPGKAGGVDAARAKEGASILAAVPDHSHMILLAIDGKERTSEGFSARIDELALNGESDFTFVIGRRELGRAQAGGRDAVVRAHHTAAQPGARRFARAALPCVQDIARRALP